MRKKLPVAVGQFKVMRNIYRDMSLCDTGGSVTPSTRLVFQLESRYILGYLIKRDNTTSFPFIISILYRSIRK